MEVVIKGLQDHTWGHYTLATFRHLDAPMHHAGGSDNAQVYIAVTGMVKHLVPVQPLAGQWMCSNTLIGFG